MDQPVNILLVDDELAVLEAFVDILEDEGYVMFTAESGAKAIEVLRDNPIDIVVSDIKMPGMDGLELLSFIQEDDPEIPVIMATAYASIENTIEAMRRGASNYLIKPIQVDRLRAVLAEAITKRRMLRKNRERIAEITKNNEDLKRLSQEREHVLEVIGQKLRQPLIDLQNWCELLTSDRAPALQPEHLDTVVQMGGTANKMLNHVLNMLDAEKIAERAQTSMKSEVPVEAHAPAGETETSETLDVIFFSENRLDAKILVIVESAPFRDFLVTVLRRKFHVSSAANGFEGLKMLAERPHLILMEPKLQRIDGGIMIKHVRRIASDIPILVMFDEDQTPLLEHIKSAGAQQSIKKPLNIGSLFEKITSLVETTGAHIDHSTLIVCQNPEERYALYHLFDPLYQTQIAATPEKALAVVNENFSMLVIDVTGIENSFKDLTMAFREACEDIKIIVLCSNRSKEFVSTVKKLGVNTVIIKPYSFDVLLKRVRHLFGIKDLEYNWESIFVQLS